MTCIYIAILVGCATASFEQENALSAGAVEAGMDKYFLASLAMAGNHDS